jgi:ABC-type transport system involved in multi-copper enzyme maturation permease subunit
VTAIEVMASARGTALSTFTNRFAGFGNFARKDIAEWFRTRRALYTGLGFLALILLGVLVEQIYGTVKPEATDVIRDPSLNLTNAGWETAIPLFAIFSTMGLLAAERENRTLAWSLSMPLTRAAVLASKVLTSILALAVLVVIVPDLVSIVVVRLVYGGWPSAESMVWPALAGASVGLFLVVLNVAASVFFRGQRAVAGVALAVALIIPGLISSMWTDAMPWWPISIGDWATDFGAGKAVNSITPIVYAVSLVALLVAAQIRFGRDEL